MRILGIDPGSRVTGFGVIAVESRAAHYVTSGVIRCQDDDFAYRLKQIFEGISQIIARDQPDEIAIEQVFVHRNVRAALKLGQARGAALVAARLHCEAIYEYAPRQIKQAVVGYGAAEKQQVAQMVVQLLQLTQTPPLDATDALAIALCHSSSRQTYLTANRS